MYIRRKVFSTLVDEETGEERLFSTTEFINEEIKQKTFGTASKVLGVLYPGSYQAKEAAKYAYDEGNPEYDSKKYKYALLGAFAPGTSTIIKKRAEKMARDGKSKKEIKEYLENASDKRVALGAIEALSGAGIVIGRPTAYLNGVLDKYDNNRAWDKNKDKTNK